MTDQEISESGRKTIRAFFDAKDQRIFKTRELQRLIHGMRATWELPASISFDEILGYTGLRKIHLSFPSRPEVRYCKAGTSVYELSLCLQKNIYVTHHTALFLNGLADDEPTDVYVNAEQSEKPRWDTYLEQKNIDLAFKRRPRTTNRVAQYERWKIHQLSGKQTGGIGIVSKHIANGIVIQTAGIESTLIDVAVRPAYCGGVEVVISAFRASKGSFSVPLLAQMLEDLDYLYP